MAQPVRKSVSGTDVEQRRREIEQCLAACDLVRLPHQWLQDEGPESEESTVCRLRLALEDLGRVFSAFGLYLSSRVDLLSAEDCLELAAIEDRTAAAPTATVRELLSRELGRSPDEVYAGFEVEPLESRLLFQTHRARLHDGRAVVVAT